MSTDNKSEAIAKEYSEKANEAMDKVTDDQNENIKEKVKEAREATLDSDPGKKAVE